MVDEKMVYEALSHLGAALAQSISTDDQTIIGHIRCAYIALGGDPSKYVGHPWMATNKLQVREGFVVRKLNAAAFIFPWTRSRLHIRLENGGVVDRYELWPIGPEHLGATGLSFTDIGRRLVVDYSVTDRNWTKVEHVEDVPETTK